MTHPEAMVLARAKRAEARAVREVAMRCSPVTRRAREALAAVLEAEAARLECGWISAGEAAEAVMLRIGMGML